MEKERRIKVLSLVALIVAVLGLTVAFAALSQMLTINGTAKVNEASWDVHFANLGNQDTYGSATLTLPTLSETTLSNYAISVTKPSDYASFEFDIVNNGTIDAKISNIDKGEKFKACKEDNSSYEDCLAFDLAPNDKIDLSDNAAYNGMIDYNFYYVDTDEVLKQNDVIRAGETKRVRLQVYYRDEATELFKNPAELTTGTATIDFVQVD